MMTVMMTVMVGQVVLFLAGHHLRLAEWERLLWWGRRLLPDCLEPAWLPVAAAAAVKLCRRRQAEAPLLQRGKTVQTVELQLHVGPPWSVESGLRQLVGYDDDDDYG